MKEVKAYIRSRKAEGVIRALEEAGISGMTLIDVMALGTTGIDPKDYKYSIEYVKKYSKVAKLEIICPDEDVHKIVEIIRQKAYTGSRGDGMIFVSPVEMGIKIRTGAIGEEGLYADKERGPMVMDPVCDMQVDEKAPGATSIYKGKTYYFCCTACKDKFDKEPEKYVRR
ncbi:MAG: P-II family nitrogen regulator [Candidatus Aminicenantales bacterium]